MPAEEYPKRDEHDNFNYYILGNKILNVLNF